MLKTIIVPEVNTNKWADLPADILTRILKHLDLNTDLTRLRGVCPSWRSALPLEEHYPSFRSHIQVPSLPDGTWCDRPLYLIETAFYFFSPINSSEGGTNSSGWVARMGQIASRKWRLLNPLSYDDFYNPAASRNDYLLTDPPIVGEINLLDCRVFMLAKALTLVDELDFNAKSISTKVVGQWDLTSSTRPLSAILVQLDPDPDSGFYSSRLLMLRPNDAQKQENEWAEISECRQQDNKRHNFDEQHDIAYSNGNFFVFQVIGNCWRIRTVNPSNKMVVLKPFARGRTIQTIVRALLVPSISNDCLYLVVEPDFGYIQCFYLILNEFLRASGDESKKKTINNFEEEFLFCSNYLSFSFQSTTLLNSPLLQHKNSVTICNVFFNNFKFNFFGVEDNYCYSNHMPKGVECLNLVKYRYYRERFSFCITKEENAYDRFVLQFDNVQKIYGLFFDAMSRKERQDYTKMFFPPPAWVKWRCPSLDDVEVTLDNLPDYSSSDDDDDDYVR